MIYNIDVKGLEVVCAAYLSKDVTMYQELNDMVDMHTENQKALGLPEGKEGRGIAKIFLFRIIYGGSIFHKDPNFVSVSTNRKFWDKKLELFFEKYYGLKKWHSHLLRTVADTGMLVAPTGRTYKFEYVRDYKGDLKLPDTQIKNWIVQGLGADIVSILRVDFYKRFKEADLPGLFINTVHDSIVS